MTLLLLLLAPLMEAAAAKVLDFPVTTWGLGVVDPRQPCSPEGASGFFASDGGKGLPEARPVVYIKPFITRFVGRASVGPNKKGM